MSETLFRRGALRGLLTAGAAIATPANAATGLTVTSVLAGPSVGTPLAG